HDPALEKAKLHATNYVSGFNAADPALVGVHWLVDSARAEKRIEGTRAFRPQAGYSALVELFTKKLTGANVEIRTAAVVDSIRWRDGRAEIGGLAKDAPFAVTARRVLVTVPLAVLQTPAGERGSIRFVPALPANKLRAMEKLEMGKVIRVVFKFHSRFWKNIAPGGSGKTLSDLSFLFSDNALFPTWWTRFPDESPLLTGWAPFRSAEQLSGKDESFIVTHGLNALSKLLGIDRQTLQQEFQAAHYHDWQLDPFARGAYSYGKVGSAGAQQELGSPIDNTLFFAGEATDVTGNNGTVHGAMASGYRAAEEILKSL
ncbi:MAG TPA: NAD(P)/FAD-dependent oxidoreductase, partial [Candidatus Binatia bacterium]|nr:NAD(P)/FAD-dependent oxidoreductase [Candidatus Binatia bacterium]